MDFQEDIGNTWLGLSDYLIEPISEYLIEGDLLYFVPYGPLHYFPIHALKLDDEPLIKRHAVSYVPNASLIKFCQHKGSKKIQSCASFGVDPSGILKEIIEKEARDVAALFGARAYLDSSATEENVLKNCIDRDIIHFSCHGKFNYNNPLSSGIELYDEVLTAKKVFNMRLNTGLITLSACETGISKVNPGDELIGLTRAFLYAGTPSVVVSLWSVHAYSTQELMLEFYYRLKNGQDKATALQLAQVKIMEKEEYSHPYYWAPFVLIGDWQ